MGVAPTLELFDHRGIHLGRLEGGWLAGRYPGAVEPLETWCFTLVARPAWAVSRARVLVADIGRAIDEGAFGVVDVLVDELRSKFLVRDGTTGSAVAFVDVYPNPQDSRQLMITVAAAVGWLSESAFPTKHT